MSKNEDVIELGSSDEEAKPAPKKRKLPNAMVVIPGQRPLKFVRSNSTIIQKAVNPANTAPLLTTPIMFRNINNNCNANILKKSNDTSTPPAIQSFQTSKNNSDLSKKLSINPLGYIKHLAKQITVKKMPSNKKSKGSSVLQGSKLLSNLPPGLTIKPVSQPGVSGTKREPNVSKLKMLVPESSMEIDYEGSVQCSSGSPQWYLRPEEQGHIMQPSYEESELYMGNDNTDFSMEDQNNMEPDALKFVEIVIEDSPVKHNSEIGKELSITIEDSPVKPVITKDEDVDSDSERCADKTSLSKKKLQYPKENIKDKEVVEIEIDMCESGFNSKVEVGSENLKEQASKKCRNTNNEECFMKNTSICDTFTPKETNEEQKKTYEFHPEYQKFIDLCFELENSPDMNKIVEKKIKAYYKQCSKEYVESEEFIEMVSSKVISMKANPDKMYLYIKDIVDEINLQRKMSKAATSKKDIDKDSEELNTEDIEDHSYDYKKQRQIRKLEKTIKKLHRTVQKLEEQEVDFEDDEDSVYLLTERYKERLVKVYEKLFQITNTKMPSEPRIHLEARPGQPSGPAKKLETWINKKVPIGTPLPFPDFHDVVHCVREANKEERLDWSEMEIMEEARDLFTRCGKKLQRRRQENEWRIASSRVDHHADPAESSTDLQMKFEDNKKMATTKELEVLNKYVEKQNQMKLEAVEIGDKEAEESPVESEEDDDITEENSSLDDKQKRKHTLQKLIHEKTKKNEAKKNNSLNVNKKNVNQTENENQTEDEIKVTDSKTTEADGKSNNDESEKMKVDELTERKQDNNEEKEVDPDKHNWRDSDDGTNISGIDELNLLSKLYSENEINSSQEYSDSDSSVMSLGTIELDSDSENNATQSIDVISIENSSYSENDSTMDGHNGDEVSIHNSILITNKEIVENILLASSDEDEATLGATGVSTVDCINLKDDNISITETTIDGVSVEKVSIAEPQEMYENNNATQVTDNDIENNEEDIADSLTCPNDSGKNIELDSTLGVSVSDSNGIGYTEMNQEIIKGCTEQVILDKMGENNADNINENQSDNQSASAFS